MQGSRRFCPRGSIVTIREAAIQVHQVFQDFRFAMAPESVCLSLDDGVYAVHVRV